MAISEFAFAQPQTTWHSLCSGVIKALPFFLAFPPTEALVCAMAEYVLKVSTSKEVVRESSTVDLAV